MFTEMITHWNPVCMTVWATQGFQYELVLMSSSNSKDTEFRLADDSELSVLFV